MRPGTSAGVNTTVWDACGARRTSLVKVIAPISPRTRATTGSAVRLVTSALTVRRAVFSEGTSRSVSTYGCLSVTGPLSVRYTWPHSPMFLSAGVGFQSTHMIARSSGSGPKTSTASALAPATAIPVTSNSKCRNVPTTSVAVPICRPFSQMFAR